MFMDVHCHLDFCEKETEFSALIGRARQAGVRLMIAQGVAPASNRRALALAQQYKEVHAALGLYPIDALQLSDGDIDKELDFFREKRTAIAALGEIGLDFKEDEQQRERQKYIFRKLLWLARELDKAVVVHSRKAEKACIEMLEQEKLQKVVMHCFSGKWSLIERVVANGWFLTIPTNVTVSEHFQRIAREIPLKHLLCETDAPYLHPDKLWPNEPANVVRAYHELARLKGIPLEDVKAMLAKNAERLLGKR